MLQTDDGVRHAEEQADGYGSSNIYVFTRDGKFTNRTFGGKGKEHGKFENCHGMDYDPRVQQMAVADRT